MFRSRRYCNKIKLSFKRRIYSSKENTERRIKLYSSFNFACTHTFCANVNLLSLAVYNSSNLSDVRFPCSVASSVRVADLYSENCGFSANFTFCHCCYTSCKINADNIVTDKSRKIKFFLKFFYFLYIGAIFNYNIVYI